ncbi:hypothetical protein GTY84_17665 [Streptomyces sp. SID8352]|nr:hypothetical protein [Streptomyces sp. SID8352]
MDRPPRGTGRRRWAAWTEVDRAVPLALPAADATAPDSPAPVPPVAAPRSRALPRKSIPSRIA